MRCQYVTHVCTSSVDASCSAEEKSHKSMPHGNQGFKLKDHGPEVKCRLKMKPFHLVHFFLGCIPSSVPKIPGKKAKIKQ